jgi:hypothetical protein
MQQTDRRVGLTAASPAWRAPRPQSWSPPIPRDRIPVPPPPIAAKSIAPRLRAAAAVATNRGVPVEYVPRAMPVEYVSRVAPDEYLVPLDDDDALLDAEYLPVQRSRAVGWFLLFLLPIAAGVVVVSWMRPDLTERAGEAAHALVGPSSNVSSPAALAPSPGIARPTAPSSVTARVGSSASSEPPLVSVWSLPVAHVGSPSTPVPAFHVPAAPLVPTALFAQNATFTPTVTPPRPTASATPIAPAPAAPPAAVAPVPVAAPVPLPAQHQSHKFAPGSLEDQIQKAVEAEEKKKQ